MSHVFAEKHLKGIWNFSFELWWEALVRGDKSQFFWCYTIWVIVVFMIHTWAIKIKLILSLVEMLWNLASIFVNKTNSWFVLYALVVKNRYGIPNSFPKKCIFRNSFSVKNVKKMILFGFETHRKFSEKSFTQYKFASITQNFRCKQSICYYCDFDDLFLKLFCT